MIRTTVYFVRNPETGLIKIGATYDLRVRLSTMRRKEQPQFEVLATQPGTIRIEGRVHARLIEHHVGHEWFRPHDEVLALIAGVKWGFIDLSKLPDIVSPLRTASAKRGHESRKRRLLAEAA
jgi:hypothetical protein